MLSKKQKIKRAAFPALISKGKAFHSSHVTLRIVRNAARKNNASRFSFVVSAKVARKATERNRFKRKGYAVVRTYLKHIKPSHLYAFFFKKGASALSASDMEKEIVSLLVRAGALTFGS